MTQHSIVVNHVAAFTCDGSGGNPAGVAILPHPIEPQAMQVVAKDVGYAETAFLWPNEEEWEIRYFSPTMEIPFCGHATIASGAVLAETTGKTNFSLRIANGDLVSLDTGHSENGSRSCSLMSPRTKTESVDSKILQEALSLFGLREEELDLRLQPKIINAGANHFLLGIKTRERLTTIGFSYGRVREFQKSLGLATVSLVHAETNGLFHARNPFPIGGLFEDPATGAAAAALAGYLRELSWPFEGEFDVIQGEDIGQKSLIHVHASNEIGAPVKVTGETKEIAPPKNYPINGPTEGNEGMNTPREIKLSNVPAPGGHYCQALTDGHYLYCSGVIALGPDNELVGDDAKSQAVVVLNTLKTILESAGSSIGQVVSSTVYVTDMADFKDVNQAFADCFGDHRPARCTVAVAALPRGAIVEIDAKALLA